MRRETDHRALRTIRQNLASLAATALPRSSSATSAKVVLAAVGRIDAPVLRFGLKFAKAMDTAAMTATTPIIGDYCRELVVEPDSDPVIATMDIIVDPRLASQRTSRETGMNSAATASRPDEHRNGALLAEAGRARG